MNKSYFEQMYSQIEDTIKEVCQEAISSPSGNSSTAWTISLNVIEYVTYDLIPIDNEDKNMTICEDCLHREVCRLEGSYDEALTFCSDKISDNLEWIEDTPGIYRCPSCGHTEGKHRAFCCDCGSKFRVEPEANSG